LQGEPPDQNVDSIIKEKVISELAVLIEDNYVFPEIAEKIAAVLRKKHTEKAYDTASTLQEFIQKVTEDLRSVNNDGHLGIIPKRDGVKSGESSEEIYQNMYLKRGPFHNFGFKKADRLLGKVGFLVINEFFYVDLEGENVAGETAKAVMMTISHSSALIIDLRDNFGGREKSIYIFWQPSSRNLHLYICT
jgi:hypothetical protein